MKKKNSYFSEAFAIVLSLIILIPVYVLFSGSFKTSAEAAEFSLALPIKWNIIENYSLLFERAKIPQAFTNSVIVTSITVVLSIAFSSMAAFILQRKKGKISEMIYMLFVAGLVIPGNTIVMYFIIRLMGFSNTYQGAILAYLSGSFPLMIFLYFGYFKSIPTEIDESAIIDGAGLIRLFYKIIFPLVKPVTATAVVLLFMNVWNDFGTAIYFLTKPRLQTLVMQTYGFFSEKSSDWNLVFANLVLVSMPVIILYFFAQRYIVAGMTSGAVKG